jgi:quercetin dioxygenase-like cupin family protein
VAAGTLKAANVSALLSVAVVGAMSDAPIEQHSWGRIVWLSSAAIWADSKQTLGYVEIDAGETNYRHRHPNCEEVLLLVEGDLEHWVGDAVITMKPGSSLRIPLGVVHWATNPGSSPARMIVAYPTGFREIELVREEAPLVSAPT